MNKIKNKIENISKRMTQAKEKIFEKEDMNYEIMQSKENQKIGEGKELRQWNSKGTLRLP